MNSAIKYVHTLVKTKTNQKKKKVCSIKVNKSRFPVSWSTPISILRKFNWVAKVSQNWIGFALLRLVIGWENSPQSLNQSDAKLKPLLLDQLMIP